MDYTPWEELVINGFSKTTIIDKENIIDQFRSVCELSPDYSINLYGDGHAADAIVKYLYEFLLREGRNCADHNR